MKKFFKWLFGWRSKAEVWRDCVYAEAASRGYYVEPQVRNGYVYAYHVINPVSGRVMIFGARK